MNQKKFWLLFVLELVLLTALKIWLYDYQVFANIGAQQILFWLLTIAITAAVIRRFGILSLFEAGLLTLLWIVVGLLLDLIFTSKFTGLGLFASAAFWYSYGLMVAAVFVFHKKRHIHIRHQLHAAKLAREQAEHGHQQEFRH